MTDDLKARLRKLHDNSQFAKGFDPAKMDWLDELADTWMEETNVQRMLNAMASIAISRLPDDLAKRTREGLATIAHQCFVEGAIRIGEPVLEANSRLADRIEALEAALNLAANRLARCALDHGIGTREFLEVSEWGEEARAALAGGGDE